MKKLVLATAVAAMAATAAQAAPSFYGKASVQMNYTDSEANGSSITMDDGSSRLGLKGSESIGGGASVDYKLEYGLRTESEGSEFALKKRDSYVGLSTEAGHVRFGRQTSIDGDVDFATVGKGMYDQIGLAIDVNDENGNEVGLNAYDANRKSNNIIVRSANMGGLQAGAMYVMEESEAEQAITGVMGKYESDMFNAGAAYTMQGDNSWTRVSGNFSVTPELTLGALYQLGDYDTDNNENAIVLSAKYGMGDITVWGQADMWTNVNGFKDANVNEFSGGVSTKLAKKTTFDAYVGMTSFDSEVKAITDQDTLGFGLGLTQKF